MLQICTDDNFQFEGQVLRLSDAATVRSVTDTAVESDNDGEVERVSGMQTMMEASTSWRNSTGADQHVTMRMVVGPRSVTTSSPNEIGLTDWYASDSGMNPVVRDMQNNLGGAFSRIRMNAWSENSAFGTRFFEVPNRELWRPLGTVPNGDSVLARFWTTLETLSPWREPAEELFEAKVYTVRLQLWAMPNFGRRGNG